MSNTSSVFDYFKIKNKQHIEDFILAIKENHLSTLNYEYNPYYVLDRINNRQIRREIISQLLELKYDFKSNFPYDQINIHNPILQSVKTNLIKEYNYYNFYIKKGKRFKSKNNLKVLICKTKINMLKFIFRQDIDIYINWYDDNYLIAINPALKVKKNNINLFNLYNKLDKIEKDNWIIWKNNFLLKTKKTNVTDKEIIKYIKEFTLINS